MGVEQSKARAVADTAEGVLLASVEVAAPPERVFRAITSAEICDWWVRPGVFNTSRWNGDARPGGRWRASGEARGRPYTLEGEFLEVDSPHRVVHTWHPAGVPAGATTLTYAIEMVEGGTRLTLRQAGFTSAETCRNTAIGWETSFERLAVLLGERVPAS